MFYRKLVCSFLVTASLPWIAYGAPQGSDGVLSKRTPSSTPAPQLVPGEISQKGQLPAAYNAGAAYQCRGGYDLFFTGDYIYWDWTQASMKAGDIVVSSSSSGHQKAFVLSPGYASGFQVGFGSTTLSADDWQIRGNYTWYQNSVSSNTSISSGTYYRYIETFSDRLNFFSGDVSLNQKMNYNELELLLERPFYFGKRLLSNIGVGLASLWVVQHNHTNLNGTYGVTLSNVTTQLQSQTDKHFKVWCLGPRVELDTSWLLGEGVAFLANATSSLVYARYYNLSANGQITTPTGTSSLSQSFPDNFNTLRPILQMFLGMGWNQGFNDNSWRVGLSAGYDFAMYWNFDMLSFTSTQGNLVAGNMFLHGLNAQIRFDF